MRPNIHIEDVTDLYVKSLEWSEQSIDGKIFNAGYDNQTVSELAETVRRQVGEEVGIVATPTDDNRSYHISSNKIERELGFVPVHSTEEAVGDLLNAFETGKIPNSMNDERYFNIKRMQSLKLK